jgi:hypothetical protein
MTTASDSSRKRTAKQRPSLASASFGRFLMIVGAAILLLGGWGAVQGARTWQWPRAEARIIDSDLRRNESNLRQSANGDYYRDHWYTFAVHYSYRVGTTEYIGGGVEPYDFGMQNSAGARKMKDRHPVGATAKVAYDPDNPAVAYLEPGPSSFALILLAIGAILGLCGLWVRSLARRGIGVMEGEGAPS